ncbi:short-chain dehydrogenase [Bosea sp. Root483D1]|uniref:SDR family NAD(P)-dependent oxidoreductase n=1 Tax=Bosea sp. Root483D1 TaxID=1736544 RepID=UPI00070C3985|nr:SDR family oxidoreductase [Bosea sp. Root483D1]KRE24514.1 short-chain dehydrogenase [Bosea sp. Root483D1]
MASQSSRAPALSGKVAIVTGGGTGIGLAIARMFVDEGAQVVIAGRSQAALDEAAAVIGAHAIAADVSQEADASRLAQDTAARFGGVDILVNNAGVTGQVANAEDLDIAQWDETMAINIRGTILCIKHCVPLMRARGGGSIINMSSLMGLRGYPMRSAYTATKFAVIGITEAVAQEVGVHGIRVNALCPGAVNGELMQRVIAARVAKENRPAEEIIRLNYTDKAALKRWVEPEEVARAALFLASEQSSSITSERLKVDAGRM